MPKTVLVVDDSPTMRQMVSFTLREAEYDVVEAQNGQDALQKMQGHTLSLIVTDLNMPELDGIGLIRAVRGQPQTKFVPVLMLTTESQPDKKLAGKAAGATGWIVKPFDPARFLAVISKILL
jgi:two-component system, chemotaxis family, chemotaxis protein CheY